jgi:hypothetical protein
MRTGPKSVVLGRDEIRALFTGEEEFARDALTFIEREDARCRERRLMQENEPTFHLAVIPAERYEPRREPFNRGHGVLKSAPLYHGGYDAFHGCQAGYEALETTLDEGRSISRLFIANDWSFYAQVVHLFNTDHGRVKVYDFEHELCAYMAKIAQLADDEGLHGPFCIAMAIRGLQTDDKVGWAFPNTREIPPEPILVDRVDDPEVLRRFHLKILRGSRYGG